jgi:phosphohistidine phosphatase
MRLYFVRHGKAEQSAASDEQRQLTAEGQARLATEAQVIARLGIHPQVIYSSPRIRAQQTAQIIAQALGMTITVQEALDYGFNRDAVAALIRDLDASAELMFVGHNPTLPQVVHSLTGSSIEMKTGSLARVDVLSASELHGILVWLIAPKVFDALAG